MPAADVSDRTALPDRGLASVPCINRNPGCISMAVAESGQHAAR